jgi:hypothetical protein
MGGTVPHGVRRRGEGSDTRDVAGRGGVRHSIQLRQPAGSDPGTPAMGGRARLLKTLEVGH